MWGSGIDALHFGQCTVTVHQVFPGGEALLFPKGIALGVAGKGHQVHLADPFPAHGGQHMLHQCGADAPALEVPGHRRVADIPPGGRRVRLKGLR